VINLGKRSLGSWIWIGVDVHLRFGHDERDEVTNEWSYGVLEKRHVIYGVHQLMLEKSSMFNSFLSL
jgi:hypothetical protein